MKKHFVEFASPGTFVPEATCLPIESWNVESAVIMAASIKERYSAVPYGFRFLTRERGDNDLDSRVSERSHWYYLGGMIRTAEEVLAGTDPKEEILRGNVRRNGIKRILVNDNSWRATLPLQDEDVVLEYEAQP